jgi:hypothetical protein
MTITAQETQNNPENKPKLAAAIVFAKDEPCTAGNFDEGYALPKTGVNAGIVLMGNFPSMSATCRVSKMEPC